MTDSEYAVRIYREIFHTETDGGDAYTRGILDAITTLNQREQAALESYYRRENTFERTGGEIGVSGSRASQIVRNALLKLRHPSRSRNMSVAKIIEHKDKKLEEASAAIAELDSQIRKLLSGDSVALKTEPVLAEHFLSISELDLSSRIYNNLIMAGIDTVGKLLALNDYYELWKIRGVGTISLAEITIKMKERGYTKWVERIENSKTF